ncbi:hypothetical protein OPV22_014532 [Ensete ventricosum]|uniref:Uncharacterized protein n=1 Tax=Ensete ventricosum TaxID=4639 RepID=A0AAV8RC39_ENSVE|nr:hypothetical protein OPV22_014532 [Ensete ventricosum]
MQLQKVDLLKSLIGCRRWHSDKGANIMKSCVQMAHYISISPEYLIVTTSKEYACTRRGVRRRIKAADCGIEIASSFDVEDDSVFSLEGHHKDYRENCVDYATKREQSIKFTDGGGGTEKITTEERERERERSLTMQVQYSGEDEVQQLLQVAKPPKKGVVSASGCLIMSHVPILHLPQYMKGSSF